MTPRVMPFNVLELRRLSERRNIPIQLPHPPMQVWIPRSDVSEIRLEVLHVHAVKSDDGGEKADIGFGDAVVEVILSF